MFASHVFDVSAEASPPNPPEAKEAALSSSKKRASKRRRNALSWEKVGPIAASIFVALILGLATLWDLSSKNFSESARHGARSTASKPAAGYVERALYEPGHRPSRVKRRNETPSLSDRLAEAVEASRILGSVPDHGGKSTPRSGFRVEAFNAEMRLRERLQREGKLRAEPGVIEDVKEGLESAKDELWKLVSNTGEGLQ